MSMISIGGVKPVKKKLADGTIAVYLYHRATGRRLPGSPGEPAFSEAYRQAEAAAAGPVCAVRTIDDLIRAYQAAPAWTELKASTRETEQFHITAILGAFGSMALADASGETARDAFLRWHAERANGHPRDADARLARLARIFKFAATTGLLSAHPLPTFKRAYRPQRAKIMPLSGDRPASPQQPLPANAAGPTPRLFSKAQAAAYCGLTTCAFDRWRKEGRMPAPLPGTSRWDRLAIDSAIDDLSKLAKLTAPAPAPLEEADPLDAWKRKRDERRALGQSLYRSPKEIRDAWKSDR